jgi:very-short-patch-repair endonuclease
MTRAEVFLWIELRNKNLAGYKFRRQFSIGPYILDFYSPRLKLAIEIDGATHVSADEREHDKNRQKEIENLGVQFLRFTNADVYDNRKKVLEEIYNKIKELK